jgi:WD40 repeat protein
VKTNVHQLKRIIVKKLLFVRSIAAGRTVLLLSCIAVSPAFTSFAVAAQSSSASSSHSSEQVESNTDHKSQETSVPAKIFLETGHTGPIKALAFSPDGQWLTSAGEDRTVKVWDVQRLRVIRTLTGHSDQVNGLAFSPDGKLLVSCSQDGTIRIWNPADNWASSTLAGTGIPIFSVVFSNDGSMVISGDLNGLIVARDVRTGTEIMRLNGHGVVNSLAVSPVDGALLASGTSAIGAYAENAAHLWDLSKGTELCKLTGYTGSVRKVAFNPDGKVLLAGSHEDGYKAWDAHSGKELQKTKTDARNLIGFTPEGGLLTSAAGTVYLSKDWTGADEKELKGAVGSSVVANFGAKVLASSEAFGGEVRLWDIAAGHERPPSSEPRDIVSGIAISPDGHLLASVSVLNVQLWNLLDSSVTVLTPPAFDGATSVAFSQDGKSLASWGNSYNFSVWDVSSGKKRFTATHEGTLNCVAFRPGSDEVASASDDHTIRIWDASTGKLLKTLQAYAGAVVSLAFTADGTQIVSYGWESGDSSPHIGVPQPGDRYALKTWDVGAGRELKSVARVTNGVDSPGSQLLVTPDGRRFVSPRFKDVWVQDSITNRIVQKLHAEDIVFSTALSPDGSWMASGVGSNSLVVWDLESGYPVQDLKGHTARVDSVAFASTRTWLASAGGDGTIRIWDLANQTILATLVSFQSGKDSVVITRDKYFSGTPNGEAQLSSTGEDYSSKRELPNSRDSRALWTAISALPEWSAVKSQVRVFPPPKVTLALPQGFDEKTAHSRKLPLMIHVTGNPVDTKPAGVRREGIKEVELWQNGQLLRIWSGDMRLDLQGQADLKENVTLAKGKNEFSAFATAISGKRSAISHVTVTVGSFNPELMLQRGNGGQINDVRFSSNGALIASAGRDRTIVLWDSTTGRQLRRLIGHEGPVMSVSFSPDGELLASGGDDHNILLWRVATGQRVRTLTGHSESVLTVAFSPKGHILASGSQDLTVGLWDTTTGREVRTFVGQEGGISCVAFSGDGELLASASLDRTVRVWNVETGRTVWILGGHSGPVEAVGFSPDKRVLVSGEFNGTIREWDLKTGKLLRSLEKAASTDAPAEKQPFLLDALSFSPDGHWLVSADGFTLDPDLGWLSAADVAGTIKIFDAKSLTQVRELRDGAGVAYQGLSFSPNGKRMAWADSTGRIQVSDVSGNTDVTKLSGQFSTLSSMSISRNGKRLATGGDRIHLWNLEDGTSTRVLPSDGDVQSLAFSLDENNLVSTESERIMDASTTLKFWNLISNKKKSVPQGGGGAGMRPYSLASSPDGKWLASTMNTDYAVYLWDASTGKRVKVLTGAGMQQTVSFSDDGKLLVSTSFGTPILLTIWDRDTGRQLRSVDTGQFNTSVALFAPGNHSVVAAGLTGVINIWDATTWAKKDIALDNSARVNALAFSPAGDLLAAALADGYIRIWNPETGELVHTLEGYESAPVSVSFLAGRDPSASRLLLVSEGAEGTIRLWDAHSGDLLATLLNYGSGTDWLVVAPDGLFDGTPAAWKQLNWRFSSETFDVASVEIFFSQFYHPGLLSEIISGDVPKAPVDIAKVDRRQPQIKLSLAAGQTSRSKARPEVAVQIEVAEAPTDKAHTDKAHAKGSGLRDLRLFRNGSQVKMWHGPVTLDRSGRAVVSTQLTIVAGDNQLTAYAFNNDNIKSEDATLTIKGDSFIKRKGTAYIVAIGVDHYDNANFDLRFAAADAQDFAQVLQHEQTLLGTYEHINVVSLLDEQATRDNILTALARLAGTDQKESPSNFPPELEQLKRAQPEDTILIYFAGHGATAGARFYLLPHDLGYMGARGAVDAAAMKAIVTHSISDEDLEQALEPVDAGRIALVIDACNSGQALESKEKRRGPMNSKGLAQLAYEKGMYILTAAQGYQAALEVAQVGHGLLTYALIEEGLRKGAADFNPKDGKIELREWVDFATQRVPELQLSKIDEAQKAEDMTTSTGDKGGRGDPRMIGLQHPRVFYRRETDAQQLIIAKPVTP